MVSRRTTLILAAGAIAFAGWAGNASAGPNQWSTTTPWLCMERCQYYSNPSTPTGIWSNDTCQINHEGMWMEEEFVITQCGGFGSF